MKKIILATLAALAIPATVMAEESPFKAGDFMLRARALNVRPDVDSNLVPIGGTVRINNTVVPELDLSYFLTPNVSFELIAAVTPHDVHVNSGAASGTDAGRAWLLPPTLTAQYHFTQFAQYAIPYVGAGVNYTHFFDTSAGALGSVKYSDSIGGALQAGVDIPFKDNWYFNFDVKKVYISTHADFAPSGIRANVDIDPWIVGVGVGYKF